MPSQALSGALFGAGRAIQDERRLQLQEEESSLRQETQREALAGERAIRPLRERAQALGIKREERGIELTDLNINIAKMTLAEKERATKELREAREKEKIIEMGMGKFLAGGNPQNVADSYARAFPELSQLKEDGTHAFKAVRTESGTIILTGPGGEQKILKGGKDKTGRAYSPDDELGMHALQVFNPMWHLKKKLEQDFAIEKEQVKADAKAEAARITAESRAAISDRRAAGAEDRETRAKLRLGESILDKALKTGSIPGHYANVYSSDDDAKLRRFMGERAGDLIRRGEDEEKAVNKAIEDVRNLFASSKREALDAADTLNKAKVNPKDGDAVAAKAKAGDKAAQALRKSVARIARELGEDAARYLIEQLPAPRK